MSLRSIIVATCICATLSTVSFAESIRMYADGKTTFIWTGEKQNPGKSLYILTQKGSEIVASYGAAEINFLFYKADIDAFQWCSYIGTDVDYKGCIPDKKLKLDGNITIE